MAADFDERTNDMLNKSIEGSSILSTHPPRYNTESYLTNRDMKFRKKTSALN